MFKNIAKIGVSRRRGKTMTEKETRKAFETEVLRQNRRAVALGQRGHEKL